MSKSNNTVPAIERDPKWEHVQAELSKPFSAKYVSVRPGATSDTGQAMLLWFVDARAVMSRLDEVVGPENWSYSWHPIPAPDGRVAVHGQLRVFDAVKEDVGEAQDEDEPYKSAVSDAFKRCGVHFGLGRYFYSMPQIWWPYDRARRRFGNPDELYRFIEAVENKLLEVGCDPTRLNERELQIEASSTSGRTAAQASAEASPAQQDRIRELQMQKFGGSADARDRYDQFQKGIVGRVCKRSELKKPEADRLIKALMAMPIQQDEAA